MGYLKLIRIINGSGLIKNKLKPQFIVAAFLFR
jgi:hypothetical protein